MNALAERLMKQLEARGLWVERRGPDALALCGPDGEKTPEVVAACKAFKPDLLAALGTATTTRRVAAAAAQANNPENTVRPVAPQVSIDPDALVRCGSCGGLVSPAATADDLRAVCGSLCRFTPGRRS